MAKNGLKQLKGFVEAHDGRHPVELFEQPTQAEPEAPPAKNTKDDLVYRKVGRRELFLPSQAMAIVDCVGDKFGQYNRVAPQTLPELNGEQRKWAEKLVHEVFESTASLELRAAAAADAITKRKALLDQRGYQKPENTEPAPDDGFEQLTAAIGLALGPLLQELAQARTERDLDRLAREELVKDNQQLLDWKAKFSKLLPMAQGHHYQIIQDIKYFDGLNRHLNARSLHAKVTWMTRLFQAASLPQIPSVPPKLNLETMPQRWKNAHEIIELMHKYLREFPTRPDNPRQPEATDPDEVRISVFSPPRPAAQLPSAVTQPVPPAVNAPGDRATKPAIDQQGQPPTTSPDNVRTAAAGSAATDKQAAGQRAQQPGDSGTGESPAESSVERSEA